MGTDQASDRARVFISCGQAKGSDEIIIANQIGEQLSECGFDPYIAVQEQSLRGLKENIFGQLGTSEYFVFVDFKRERLGVSEPAVHRGSLFSHQELAIASYLDIEVLALREDGVKADDGIIKFLQTNAIPFANRHLLPSVIADEIKRRRWDSRWRNSLALMRHARQFSDARVQGLPSPNMGRFFHINVHNHHRSKTANNCYVYLERVVRLDTMEDVPLKVVEFKWAGSVLPNVQIPSRSVRSFDAFWVKHDMPGCLQFNLFSDSTEFIPRIMATGKYALSYTVISENFPTARHTFTLDLSTSLNSTSFE